MKDMVAKTVEIVMEGMCHSLMLGINNCHSSIEKSL